MEKLLSRPAEVLTSALAELVEATTNPQASSGRTVHISQSQINKQSVGSTEVLITRQAAQDNSEHSFSVPTHRKNSWFTQTMFEPSMMLHSTNTLSRVAKRA